MKVEKDLGFVNEIPVYVNGKKSNLRVGETTTDDAVEGVLENTKESFQKPVTVAGQSKTYYVIGIKNSKNNSVLIGRTGKRIEVYIPQSILPKEFTSDSIKNIEIEFEINISGETTQIGFSELEQMGALCKAEMAKTGGVKVLMTKIDFYQLSEIQEKEIEGIKETLKLYDVLRVKAEKIIKENMLITVQED